MKGVGFAQMLAAVPSLFAKILPYASTMCVVGLIESLLTLQLVDGLVDDGTQGESICDSSD